jgi:hypothetical protein
MADSCTGILLFYVLPWQPVYGKNDIKSTRVVNLKSESTEALQQLRLS